MPLNLTSKITLNSAEFEAGMDRVRGKITDSIKSFALGTIGVGTIAEAYRKTVDRAKELINESKRLDMTVEQVQILGKAAASAGIEFDTLATAISKIDEARAKALGGSREDLGAFRALGINRQDLLTKTAANLFTGPLSNAVKSNNIETIAEPLKAVLGRGAHEVVGTLKIDFDALGTKMKNTGAIMDGDVAAKLKLLSSQLSLMSMVITAQLAPAFLALGKFVYEVINKAGGNIAGVGGYWGAVYSHFADKDPNMYLKSEGDPYKNIRDKDGRINFWKELIGVLKSDDPAAAFKAAQKPFELNLKSFNQSLADAADALKRPAPDFQKTATDAVRMRGDSHRESDSLISIGNYLGRSNQAVSGVVFAQQTAANTKHSADALDKIVTALAKPWNNSKFSIPNPLDMGGVSWPNP